jgi:hypothetical protein
VLKLIVVVLVGLLLLWVGLSVLMRWDSGANTTAASQALAQGTQAQPDQPPGQEIENDLKTEPAPARSSPASSSDDDLKKLRETRITTGKLNRSVVLDAFALMEKRHPDDYRFPYERARLSIEASEIHSHDNAFAALSLAAEKAIDSGKANEMLDDLKKDKDGDFRKLSRGHAEWMQVEGALKRQDKSLLNAVARF